jgi:XFP C-terminal domain
MPSDEDDTRPTERGPCAVKAACTVPTGGMGRRTRRHRALFLPTYSIAMDVIDRVPELKVAGAHAKEKFRNEQIACCHYAYEHGIDKPEIVNWKWPY